MNMIWYNSTKEIRATHKHSIQIIKQFQPVLPLFFAGKKRKPRTQTVKTELAILGHKLGFKVYANHLSAANLTKIGNHFNPTEWMYDVHWYTEHDHYSTTSLELAVESEWESRRKDDKSNDFHSGVKYDFQKLLITNANLRLMIFKVSKEEELETLYTYFKAAIKGYTSLIEGDTFLFIAFHNKSKSFYYTELRK
jgi:hypothetical protein